MRAFDIDGSLRGRRALVTGAGMGIGLEVSRALARAGADVIAFSLAGDLEALGAEVTACGVRYVSLTGDVTKASDVAAVVALAQTRLGGIDILVNSAGIAIIESALETSLATWQRTLDVNLTGSFLCAQAVAPGMIARSFGRIVNISSQAGIIALHGHVAYMASKAAINGITQSLALEWGPLGITTNAIAPTVVNTELGKAVWSDPAKSAPMRAMIPVGRFAEPPEVAAAVCYLASDSAGMINGHVLRLDGGATIH